MPLTELAIRSASTIGTLWDRPNFGLRIGKQTKTWIVLLGNGRRHRIGHYPTISLADARKEARRILAEKELGRIHPTRTPFAEAVDAFLTDCGTRIRPRTLKDYTRLLKHLAFGRTAIADITARDILNQLKPLTPYEKHHAFCTAATFFRWCVRQHLIERSPTDTMAIPYKRLPHDRVLSSNELVCLWKATEAPWCAYNAIVRLLLLTGQRRGEIAHLEWSWINNEERTILFPSAVTKNKRTHRFPYGDMTAAVLASIPRIEGCAYLFPASRKSSTSTTVFNGWSKPKVTLDKASHVIGWTIHDLRRTFSSSMASLGVPQIVVEKLLNHVSQGTQSPISQVYNKYNYLPEMRDAILRYDAYLTTLIPPEGLSP